MKKIEKKEKYSLEEIKTKLMQWSKVCPDEQAADKLTSLQLHLKQLADEVHEIRPIINSLRPKQVKQYHKMLTPYTAACIEALLILLGEGPLNL